MLERAAGAFHGLDGEKARHDAAAGAACAVARAAAPSAVTAAKHPTVRRARTQLSVEARNIRFDTASMAEREAGTQAGNRSRSIRRDQMLILEFRAETYAYRDSSA